MPHCILDSENATGIAAFTTTSAVDWQYMNVQLIFVQAHGADGFDAFEEGDGYIWRPHHPGSHLIHAREKSHRRLVVELSLTEDTYDSRHLGTSPDEENPLEPANRQCFYVKRLLHAHSGFDRDDLQGWLDLTCIIMNPPSDRLAKAAKVLDRAMLFPNTLRYREYYMVGSLKDQHTAR